MLCHTIVVPKFQTSGRDSDCLAPRNLLRDVTLSELIKMSSELTHKPFTFLVLADIHFGQFSDSPEFRLGAERRVDSSTKRKSRRDGLVAAVNKLAEKPTAIFVPGDLTSIASPGEFKGCVDIVYRIACDIGISSENIFFTYGNHDINWRICELGVETPQFPADTAYERVAATIGELFAPMENCLMEGPVPGSGVFEANGNIVFVLNSGAFCVAKQAYRHGRLGSDQLQWLETALKKYSSGDRWRLLMVHHHPFNYTYATPIEDVSCIEEGAEVVDLAGQYGIDFLFHGHRHHPRLFTQSRTQWNCPMTFFCAGSVAVNAHHRDLGLIPNLFHVVSLQKRLHNRAAFGNVTSFEFTIDGWKPVRDCPATPLDHVHWFGSLVSNIETDKAIKSFLEQMLGANPSIPVMLPKREALPPELLCCSLADLNSRLSVIAQQYGLRVVGKYPDDISLLKN
jgi:3',5'-cyclic AMP phosphodiesterase CpdA